MKRKQPRQGLDAPTQAQATIALAMAVRSVATAIDAGAERIVVTLESLRHDVQAIGVRMGAARGVMVIDPHGRAARATTLPPPWSGKCNWCGEVFAEPEGHEQICPRRPGA